MASSRLLLSSALSLSLILSLIAASTSAAAPTLRSSEKLGGGGGEGVVGGRTKIKNVRTNKEVQELGRFSVHEYNAGTTLLSFVRVVAAQRQVVAGVKYFLKIAAKYGNGTVETFDAVVVVRPGLKSKELLSFAPSPK